MIARAFTLLEVLAVVVILSLTMALVAVGVASADEAASIRAFTSAAVDLDRRARLWAPAGSAMELHLQTNCLRLVNRSTGEQVSALHIPGRVSVQLLTMDDEPLDTIVFDRSGCTQDYRLLAAKGERSHAMSIAGLTGWVQESRGQTR